MPTPHDRWLAAATAAASSINPLRLPYDIALREAGQVAAFAAKYWQPSGGLSGLKRVRARLPESTSAEIVDLIHATQEPQTKLLLLVDPVVLDKGERARQLIDELESAIEYLLDDGVEEPADAQFAAIREFHAQSGQRSSGLHQALSSYAELAESLKERLVEVDEDFDSALIQEAKALAATLSVASAQVVSKAAEEATALRNGFLTPLMNRVGMVRSAARRVFQANPEVLREATSTYERRKRAARRAAKATPKSPTVP